MTNESGKMNSQTLVVLDFDGTLVFEDGSHEDFDLLRKLMKSGVETAIASRNDKYHLERRLDALGISELFTYVMADFRPKSYQMKHIIWLFQKQNKEFSRGYFVDDYLTNIERMRNDLPEVHCFQYGKDFSSLADFVSEITSNL